MVVDTRMVDTRESTYKLTAGLPAQIDMTTIDQGSPAPLRTVGIYDLSGDCLTYCIGAPDRPRPDAFATLPGDGRTLAVLRRLSTP
jgi:uncharacterized protein (TIGR03067 family)